VFERVCARLASPNLELRSLLIVLASFLRDLWCQPGSRATKEQFTSIVLANCGQAHPNCPGRLVGLLDGLVRSQGGKTEKLQARQLRHAKRYVEQWTVAYGRRG
jgi:hypothetical protein